MASYSVLIKPSPAKELERLPDKVGRQLANESRLSQIGSAPSDARNLRVRISIACDSLSFLRRPQEYMVHL